MAAAVTLAERSVRVTVFESIGVPGGRARRIESHGMELDNGQHILVGAYQTLYGLMRTVGVSSAALLRLPLDVRYPNGFRLHRGAFGLGGALLTVRGVPISERLGAARFVRRLRRAHYRLERDVSVGELLARERQDGRIGHYLWRPLCVSALNTPPELASANVFLAVLRDTLGGARDASDLLLPRVDLSRLFPEPATEFVRAHGGEVHLQSPVKDLGALRQSFDHVIVAVGPHQLKQVLVEAPEFDYQPIYTCYLQYGASVVLPFPMLGLAEGLVQWVFDRGALLGEKGRLVCVISAQGDHQQMTQEEIAERCARELTVALPRLGTPQWWRVIAEKRATITCSRGSKERLTLPSIPGVSFAGDYTDPEYPPTLEAAVRSGVRAASSILALAR